MEPTGEMNSFLKAIFGLPPRLSGWQVFVRTKMEEISIHFQCKIKCSESLPQDRQKSEY
jgi:hypothetical protein